MKPNFNVDLSAALETLRNTDLSDIDLENFGNWPMPVKIVACILTLILVLFLGYNLYLTDMQLQVSRLEDQEIALKQQFSTKAFQAANLQAYKDQMQELEGTFEQLLHQLPRDTEVPGLLEDITRTGLESGLEFEEIRLQPETPRQFYTELPISITVFGSYHALATFVASVTSMPRIVTLHDFDLRPVSPNNNSRLRLAITAKTYRYNEQRGKS